MANSLTIKIIGPDIDGFHVTVEGDTIMECLSESEARDLRVGELIDYWKDAVFK